MTSHEGECFICLEPGGRKRCKCNTTVHDECLNRMMQSVPSHNGSCAVCREIYSNVQMTEHRRCYTSPKTLLIFGVFYAGLVFQIVFLIWTTQYNSRFAQIITILCCGTITLYSIILLATHYRHKKETGGFCCCVRLKVEQYTSTMEVIRV